ncbi:hypothetical protein [Arthrobacter alpinus]|uniref:hypothetical protein n=1 Tax=Arthrobacter alpinus TaxID=656366 RepID=UPI0012F8CBB5|nr:hypothetical protein [Arthrobacter alpinus]
MKGKVNHGKGAYPKTTIADDNKALKDNPAIVESSAKNLFNESPFPRLPDGKKRPFWQIPERLLGGEER